MAKIAWAEVEDERKKLVVAKDKYYKLMHEVEQSEINIEQALLEHEKGSISLD